MLFGDALIGHTGFVGGTIERSGWDFVARYNSSNIETMRGLCFDTVICAGVSATKWLANREPEADWSSIKRLIAVLSTVSANRFVLVSTVDIYPQPRGVTEIDMPDRGTGEPYGRHRLELEYWIAANFLKYNIIRLPALFGPGLKKNVLFDLLVGNMVDRINPNAAFQWYPVSRLPTDIRRIMAVDQRVLNVAVEPILTSEIVEQLFPSTTIGSADSAPVRYDMQTCFPELLGGSGCYHINSMISFSNIANYVKSVRRGTGLP